MRYPSPMRGTTTLALAAAALALAGCRGSTPRLHGLPEQGIASVVVGGRLITPTGETRSGKLWINLEGEGGREAEVYRLPIDPQETLLFQVEPGLYHLAPTRNLVGSHQKLLKLRIEGRTYKVPFPRELLRKSGIQVKPKKVVPIGVLEAVVGKALPGRKPQVRVRLDDSVAARRQLVQDLIRDMMDPRAPTDVRESAISWLRALDMTLIEVLAEQERGPLYKSGANP